MHNTGQKAQHWTQTKENNTQGALQRPREQERSVPRWDAWAFSAARSLLTTQISRIRTAQNTVHRKKTKKSHQSLRPETSGSMTTATVQIFSSFYLFMLHMTLVFSLYKCVFFIKVINAPQLSGTVKKSFSSMWYASIRLKFGVNSQKKTGQFLCMFSENTFFQE